jgi:hypothetical protein
LASRLHDILGLDRVGIDVDDDEGHGPALVLWGRCHGVPGFQKEQRRRQDALADRGQVG